MTTTAAVTITPRTNKSGDTYGYTLDTPTHEIIVTFVSYRDSWRDRNKTTRLYASADDPDMDRPPYTIKGEDPANDAAWRAYNRAEMKNMRAVATDGWASVQHLLGDLGPISFSRKAGCSCPCSPGFVTKRHVTFNGRPVAQVSVTAKDSDTWRREQTHEAARARRAQMVAAFRFEDLA